MKPDHTLSQLEREPIVYFGCTWSEIKTCLWRGGALAALATLACMLFLPLPVFWLVPGLLLWWGLAYGFTQRIHAQRVGKPLYYERHRRAVRARSAPFIPAGRIYQAERNDAPPRAPRF
jgi:hypothetical protein